MPNDTPDWAQYSAFVSNQLYRQLTGYNTAVVLSTQQYASAIIAIQSPTQTSVVIVTHQDVTGNVIFQMKLGIPLGMQGVAWEIPLYGTKMTVFVQGTPANFNLAIYGSNRQVENVNQLYSPNNPMGFVGVITSAGGTPNILPPLVNTDDIASTFNGAVTLSAQASGGAGLLGYRYTTSNGGTRDVGVFTLAASGWQVANSFIHPPVPLLWVFYPTAAVVGVPVELEISPSGT